MLSPFNSTISKERLLAEIEDVIRNMPPFNTFKRGEDQSLVWLGRTSAVLEKWDFSRTATVILLGNRLVSGYPDFSSWKGLHALLHQARHDLSMELPSSGSVAISHGMVFDYFDEVRKVIELAKEDLLFVDPYLDAEFVSRYLPHVGAGVAIRLLSRKKLSTLLPAVDVFVGQSGMKVNVRSASFHDRYIFLDRTSCYQSGASFKDGAKSAPTTVTQISDAFAAVLQTYERMWNLAKVERGE